MTDDSLQIKLVKTKHSIPKPGRFVVSRQSLNKKLDNSRASLLTTVIAPIGFGKTTAVLDWIQKRGQKAAWLSLDADDNDRIAFWQYVCAALDSLSPGLSCRTESALASEELTRAGGHLRIILDQLTQIDRDVFLILDNLNAITNSAIYTELSYLLKFAPSCMHFILIGRSEPELDLVKFELNGQLQKITSADLRFSEKEVGQYFRNRSLPLDSRTVKEVAAYTDGWISAVAAVALLLGEHTSYQKVTESIAQDKSNTAAHLIGAVLDSYSAPKRELIIKTSILDSLCPELCSAVTGMENADKIFKELSAQEEFLKHIDSDRKYYRYSRVFRDYTSHLLKEEYKDSISLLHRSAAVWYDRNGQLKEAIWHYLNGAEYDEAMRLLEPRLGELAGANAYETVLAWIKLLPDTYIENSIGIALFYSLLFTRQKRFESAGEWLKRAKMLRTENTPTYVQNPDIPIWLSAVNLAVQENDYHKLARLFGDVPPEEQSQYQMKGLFDINPSDISLYRGRFNKFIKLYMEQNKYWKGSVDEHRFMSVYTGFPSLVAGEYYYEQNQFELARPFLLKVAQAGEAVSYPGTLVPAMAGLAKIRKYSGDSRGAADLLESCDALLKTMNKPHWHNTLNALKHRLLLEDGNLAAVERWKASSHLSVTTNVDSTREYELLVFARALMFGGKTDDAERLLIRLLAFAEVEERWYSLAEILNLFAILSFRLGERQNLNQYIIKSLQIGLREGFFRIFVDEGEPMLEVLEQSVLSENSDFDDKLKLFAERIAEQIRLELELAPKTDRSLKSDVLQVLLTAKEREVLALLCNACSNNEIGQRLGISLRTVKTHTGNIYGKLGVTTRAQCIRRVHELGIPELP